MISASLSRRRRHWLRAGGLLAVFGLAHALPLSLLLHQAAFVAVPGDRLMVAFVPGTPVDAALEQLGSAGTSLAGVGRSSWFYEAEIVDAGAAHRLSRDALVFQFPGRPVLASCFSMPRGEAADGGRR